MQRAFGTLQIRAVDEEQRIVEGIANTDAIDDYGTILEPKGARFTLPMPLLWQHNSDTPVGEVVEAKVTERQIRVRAKIAKIDDPGTLKDDVDRAWQAVKHGLVKGFSVGFKPGKTAGGSSRTDPLRFVEWFWRELSLVTLPANEQATIQAVRSAYRAASGEPSPGVSGTSSPSRNQRPRREMNIQERIQELSNSRAAKEARQQALMQAATERGETLAPDEAEEFDTLAQEIDAIDGDLVRLRKLAKNSDANAAPVNGATPAAAAASRGANIQQQANGRGGTPVVRVRTNEEPGLGMARYAMALLSCKGNKFEAAEYAKRQWGEQGEGVALMLRAAVGAGDTTTSGWASNLVQTNYVDEFLALLRPRTLIGRISGLRSVPFNVSMPAQTGGGSYSWVGEGSAKPVTRATYATVTLGMAKAAGIVVLTEELVRSSSPSAQEAVREEMIAGIGGFLDNQFVDPAVAAVGTTSPASITNGVTPIAASGTTEANYRDDLNTLIGTFAENNYPLTGVTLLMSEARAWALGGVVNAVGGAAFPGLGVDGGEVRGITVVGSNAASLADLIVALHAPSVLVADEGQVEVDISREASIQMDSEPDNPTTNTTVLVSLWQRNLVGLRAERFINWKKARSTAVQVLDYSGGGS